MVDVLLHRRRGEAVTEHLLPEAESLWAPDHMDLEVMNAIRRMALAKTIGRLRADRAAVDLADFAVRRHPTSSLAPRVWSLTHNMTPYDAAYVALTEALPEATLLTTDQRLHRAIDAHTAVATILVP